MKNDILSHQFSLLVFASLLLDFIFYWHRPEKSYKVSNGTRVAA